MKRKTRSESAGDIQASAQAVTYARAALKHDVDVKGILFRLHVQPQLENPAVTLQ